MKILSSFLHETLSSVEHSDKNFCPLKTLTIFSFMFHRGRVIQVWNNMKVSKLWL